MWIVTFITIFICSLQMLSKQATCLRLIDLPDSYESQNPPEVTSEKYIVQNRHESAVRYESDDRSEGTSEDEQEDTRRYWLANRPNNMKPFLKAGQENEKDDNLKSKISTLVEQTLHDTERRVKSVEFLKEKNRDHAPYRVGFILSMVKKSRDVLNELFNVAVKHRDDWKALEQMKIFELIVHTNVDTTNLVRQLVETHIQHMNTSSSNDPEVVHLRSERKRVVLL